MKKVLALILGCAMILGIAGCAKKVEVPSKKDVKAAVEEEYDMDFKLDSHEVADDEKSAEWVFISKDGTLEVTVTWDAKHPDEFEYDEEEHPEATETEPVVTETETEPVVTETETETETTPSETSKAPSVINGKIVNFDEMHFYINGQKFILGESTLQDMIDAGVPFEKDDLENANNNLKANYQSQGFKIKLGDYYTLQLYFLNYSDEGKPISECVCNEIYLPIRDQEQDIFTLDFPLTLTEEELVADAGEPEDGVRYYDDDESNYHSADYKYQIESTKYYGGSSYEFDYVNGELKYLYITWMP